MYNGMIALSVAVATTEAVHISTSNKMLIALEAREGLLHAVNIIKVGLAVIADAIAYKVIIGLGCQDSIVACSLLGVSYTIVVNSIFGKVINLRAYQIAIRENFEKLNKLMDNNKKVGLDNDGK